MEKSSFEKFTNLYELSKTLRFELKPVWITERLISENWLKERDELRDKDYDIIKPIFDQLHDKFIRESLYWVSINWEDLLILTKNYKKDLEKVNKQIKESENEKELDKLEKERKDFEDNYKKVLEQKRNEITKSYEFIANKWKEKWKDEKWKSFIKEEGYKILTESWILKVLKKTFQDKSEIEKLINENEKALEMLGKKFEYYIKKLKEDDFSWWKKLYKWEKQETKEENFTKEQTKEYLEEILSKIKAKNIEEIQKQILSVIENFEWFWTYFWWFNTNRENYYSREEKSTWVANRIVNQNFIFFISNLELKSKINIPLNDEENKIFDINNYNLYLSQDWIDRYNEIIWWKKDKNWVRTSNWINQRLNEYAQKNNEKKIQLKPLYKQIWSIKAKSIPFEIIETPEDFKWILEKIIDSSKENIPKIVEVLKNVFESNELDNIYISKNNLSFISNRYFSNWYAVAEEWVKLKVFKKKKSSEEWDDFKIPKYISLQDLKNILKNIEYADNSEVEEDKRIYFFKKHFEENRNWVENNWEFFKQIFKDDIEKLYSWKEEEVLIEETNEKITLKSFTTNLEEIEKIFQNFNTKDQEQRKILKSFADKSIFIFQFLRLFKVDKEKIEWDLWDFYHFYDEMVENFLITKHYDAIRNYLTKKDFSEEKIKLKFDKWNLLWWWSEDYDWSSWAQYNWYIFRKKTGSIFKYYLWISNNAQVFNYNKNPIIKEIDDLLYEKMNILALKTISIFWSSYQSEYWNSYNEDKQKLSEIDLIKKVQGVLEKKYINKYKWLSEVINKNYEKLGNFVNDINFYWDYSLTFEKINWKYLEQQIYWENKDKFLYLFEIVSKDSWDIEEKKKRYIESWKDIKDFKELQVNKDLQTIYWENILNGTPKFKLNWKAEILFRQASKEVKNKNDLEDSKKHLKERNKNAIDSKRYTENKTIFHCPTIVWYWNKEIKWPKQFNDFTNWILSSTNLKDLHIIWIDRWEKHLAFYSVINAETWKIVEQWSLNRIEQLKPNWEIIYTDYEKLLTEKAWNRLKARQEWDTIWNIKNLKEWYISHVVKKIADLVLKYNWVIVMEKLNKWFKQWRQKIEQSVYQNLEVALAKKLSYLVLKNKDNWEEWSITKPYQLCPFAKNYSDIETSKQWWIIFYTTAAYTSITDPVTWWRKTIYLKKWKVDDMKNQIINAFSEIWFDESKKAYFFKLNWQKWTLYSWLERCKWKQNKAGKWEINEIRTTQELDDLFTKSWIDKNREIISQIEEENELPSKFYETFIWIFEVISQIRNTSNKKEDFLVSPIEPFYDSRKYFEKLPDINWEKFENENNIELPTSWDANWAYNIARKWLIMLKKIHRNPKIKSDKLFISNDEWDLVINDWDNFTQKPQ